MWDPAYAIQNSKSSQHLRPRAFMRFPRRMSSMFGDVYYPNFKKPIPAQKIKIFQQQAHVNIPKQRKNITCQCTNPFQSLRQCHPKDDPKILPGPRPSLSTASTVVCAEISWSTRAARPFRAAQCRGVRPQAPPGMRCGRQGSCVCQ